MPYYSINLIVNDTVKDYDSLCQAVSQMQLSLNKTMTRNKLVDRGLNEANNIGTIATFDYRVVRNAVASEKWKGLTEGHRLWIQSGCESGNGMYISIDRMNATLLGIRNLDVTTVEGAGIAINSVKTALKKIAENRASIGAQQNRLEHTVAHENNVVENTVAAESLIRDTDMAKEMVYYSNQNILQQVGQAMMAQANQNNQGILNLLK